LSKILSFAYHTINRVPLISPFRQKKIFSSGFDKVEISRSLYQYYSARLEESTFFKGTVFNQIDVFFHVIAPDCRKKPLQFVEKRKEGALWIVTEYYQHEIPSQCEILFREFLTMAIESALYYAFVKYEVEPNPFNSLPSFKFAINQPALIKSCSTCELTIFLKIPESAVTDMVAISNFSLLKELDSQLRIAELGRMDGMEIENGFQKVYFIGFQAIDLLEFCANFLSERVFEPNSYIRCDILGEERIPIKSE
jgi:hypothetical protein